MSTPGSRAMVAGLTVMLVSVSAAMHLGAGGFSLLLISFAGVLVATSLIAAAVRMGDDGPAPPIVPVVFASARSALAAFVRRNTADVALVMASCAVTMLVSGAGEGDPVLCFATFALLLSGVFLITNRSSW